MLLFRARRRPSSRSEILPETGVRHRLGLFALLALGVTECLAKGTLSSAGSTLAKASLPARQPRWALGEELPTFSTPVEETHELLRNDSAGIRPGDGQD